MSKLLNNTLSLQSILETVNNLPEAGTDLPTLENPGSASDLLEGKELIDQNGELIEGTIPTNDVSDLTVSGATVTVPSGYYTDDVSKSVATATQATPSIEVSSTGLITASASQTAGYVTSGTKNNTKQLTTQAAKTVTPSTTSQTAVASGVYTTGAVTVAAMPTATQATPSVSVSTSGLITASSTQSAGYVTAGTKSATKQLTTQAAKTVTPGTANQTAVAKNVYTTGAVTVRGDANLVAENIVKGKTIFDVTGTAEIGGTGVELPTLTTPAAESEVFASKEYIDQTGAKKTGTFTIESELSEQDDLLTTLEEILNSRSSGQETWILTLTDGTTVEKVVQVY